MMKHRISDIFKDNKKLFATNTYILNDNNLSFLFEQLPTFDLITKYDYGVREILTHFLDENELDYNLEDMHEAIYMNMLKNLRKYKLLYESDEAGEGVVPSDDYKIVRQYGEEEKHFNYGQKSATDTFSSKEDVNVYGQKQKTDVLGQAQETVTSAPRSTDSQDQRTTFDSQTDYDTTHNVTSTIETVDTTIDAQRTNTSTDATYTDRLTEGGHSVQKAEASHTDGVVYDEHTDNVYGYKGNPVKNIETFRKYLSDNTIKTIVSECINTVTYSIYLYTGM